MNYFFAVLLYKQRHDKTNNLVKDTIYYTDSDFPSFCRLRFCYSGRKRIAELGSPAIFLLFENLFACLAEVLQKLQLLL